MAHRARVAEDQVNDERDAKGGVIKEACQVDEQHTVDEQLHSNLLPFGVYIIGASCSVATRMGLHPVV